jgi:hypothetical protein
VLENDMKQVLADEVETGGAGAGYGIEATAAWVGVVVDVVAVVLLRCHGFVGEG